MIKIRIILLFITAFIIFSRPAFARDWKSLHEAADRLDMESALNISMAPGSTAEDLYIYGLTCLNRHEDVEAQRAFEMAAEKGPDSMPIRWGMAELLRRRHKIEESEAALKEIIEFYPEFYPAYISLAYIKYQQQDFTGSMQLALKVIKEGRDKSDLSNYTRAYLLLAGNKGMLAHYGGVLSKMANGIGVLANLKRAEVLQPDSPEVLFGLGSFYLLAPSLAGGSRDKALAYFNRAVELDPKFADVYVRLAQVYRAQGDEKKAGEYLAKALSIDPQNMLARDYSERRCKFICVSLN